MASIGDYVAKLRITPQRIEKPADEKQPAKFGPWKYLGESVEGHRIFIEDTDAE